eukprot:6704606-Pyramimonas_sp.AAC.1
MDRRGATSEGLRQTDRGDENRMRAKSTIGPRPNVPGQATGASGVPPPRPPPPRRPPAWSQP